MLSVSSFTTVAAFPKGPLRDVLAAELLDDLRRSTLIEQGLHLHDFLHGFDGNAGRNLLSNVELPQAARVGGGLFEGVRLLLIGELSFRCGRVGGESLLPFSSAGEVGRDSRGFQEVVIWWSVIKFDMVAIVEGRELHHVVEPVSAGRREG